MVWFRGKKNYPWEECAPGTFVKSNSNCHDSRGMPWAILKRAHFQKTGISHYQKTVNKTNLQVGEGPSIPVMSNITFGVASLHYKQDKVGSLHTVTKHCHGNFQCKLSLFDFFQHLSHFSMLTLNSVYWLKLDIRPSSL